jgi:ABC-type multidrug transport system ATPase subunit
MNAAIRVEDLGFTYRGGVRAVDGVSFEVAPGEVLGLLGPNGAGKSTTIKMLTGQLNPDEGAVEVLGLQLPAERERAQARMGVCFEEKNLYLQMSAVENLRFFARLFGIRDYDPEPLLGRVGLFDRRHDRVSGYSKGMRQRLMVADVLFLDEPTDGLDPVSARAVRAIVVEEARRGAAVVLTTHDMLEADQLSDRVAFIDEGRILAIDTPERLKLAHGSRSLRVRLEGDREELIPIDGEAAGERLAALLAGGDVLTVHTEEATLEDVFVLFAGRGLAV